MIKITSYPFTFNFYLFGCKVLRLVHSSNKSNSPLHFKYAPEIEAAVNKQIQIEQQAALDYLNIAVKFLHPCQLYPGAAGFFMRMYEEELRHMQQFILYQLRRGGIPTISCLKEPPSMFQISLLEAFRKAIEMEKSVTESLENLIIIAEKAKDYQLVDFVTSQFLSEQMRSIDELAQHIASLGKLSDEHSMYHYDLRLSKKYPYTYLTI